MGISAPSADERVQGVRFDDVSMSVMLMDGRTITVPLAWYPRLLQGTPALNAGRQDQRGSTTN